MAVQAVAVATTLELIARARITDLPRHEKAPDPRPSRIPWLTPRRRTRPEQPGRTQAP
jgi:hypothetical protein